MKIENSIKKIHLNKLRNNKARKCPKAFLREKLKKLDKDIFNENLPTFTTTFKKYRVPRYTISRLVKKYLNFAKESNNKVHFLSEKAASFRVAKAAKFDQF